MNRDRQRIFKTYWSSSSDRDRRGRPMGSTGVVLHADGRGGDLRRMYFSRLAIAAMVPIAILAISDLMLPAYNSIPVMLATYAMMTVPVWFGRLQRGEQSRWLTACNGPVRILPATLFFIVSNFAVWAFQSDYEKSLAGLAHCYWAAVPFYRWMLTGDMFYLPCCSAAGHGCVCGTAAARRPVSYRAVKNTVDLICTSCRQSSAIDSNSTW